MVDRNSLWAAVTVSVALIAGVVTLSAMGKPTADLLAVVTVGVIPVLSVFAAGKLRGIESQGEIIRNQTNGANARLLELLTQLQNVLSERVKAPSSDRTDSS